MDFVQFYNDLVQLQHIFILFHNQTLTYLKTITIEKKLLYKLLSYVNIYFWQKEVNLCGIQN